MVGDKYFSTLNGTIYEQITSFKPVEKDWNNDGDIYTLSVCYMKRCGEAGSDSFEQFEIEDLLIKLEKNEPCYSCTHWKCFGCKNRKDFGY